jgi:hypothetical protein
MVTRISQAVDKSKVIHNWWKAGGNVDSVNNSSIRLDGFVTGRRLAAMAASHAERQKAYRQRQKLLKVESRIVTRDVTLSTILELKAEIASLRDEIVTLRDEIPLNGSLKKVPSDSPKKLPSLIPNLIRSLDSEADEIYQLYPRHIAKKDFLKAYRAARKQAPFDTILDAVRKFAIECQTSEPKFIPYPATWINKGRWLDEEPKANGHAAEVSEPRKPKGPPPTLEELMR